MVSNIIFLVVMLGFAASITHIMREGYKNEQSFRAFHDRQEDP